MSKINFHLAGFIVFVLVSISNILLTSSSVWLPEYPDEYWGPGEQPVNINESIRPFKVVFEKQMIDDLKMRLNNTRMPQPTMKGQGWFYGTNSDFMTFVTDYWLNKYDFQKREEYINQYPHFLTNIQGLDIHFVHVKPQLPNNSKVEVLPMYIEHGWQGSFVEYYQLIPLLTTVQPKRNFVFELIIPSLPGFGYSSVPARPGCTIAELAHIMKNLMLRLGFNKWYTHAGDWGAFITARMASLYPEHILGLHTNWCLVSNLITLAKGAILEIPSLLLNWDRLKALLRYVVWFIKETAFIFFQGTKPDTLGFGLSDSPAGLAAYFFEKYVTSARSEKYSFGNETALLKEQNMDNMLDNIMVYWAPNKVTSGMRHHAEYLSARNIFNLTNYATVKVPSACTQFPFEILNLPENIVRKRFVNMVSFTKQPRGGHFVAMEEPQLLADDIWAAIEIMRKQK